MSDVSQYPAAHFNNRRSQVIAFLSGIGACLLFICAGYISYRYVSNKAVNKPTQTTEAITQFTETIPRQFIQPSTPEGWNNYSNTKFGYSLYLPKILQAQTNPAGSNHQPLSQDSGHIYVYRTDSYPYDQLDLYIEIIGSNSFPKIPKGGKVVSIKVNSLDMDKYSYSDTPTDIYIWKTDNQQYIQLLVSNQEDRRVLINQILHTFKSIRREALTTGWDTYETSTTGFSIRYPLGWNVKEKSSFVSFTPPEIVNDVYWAVNIYDQINFNIDELSSNVWDHVVDRQQTKEIISINGLEATKITTTNPADGSFTSLIVIDHGDKIYTISGDRSTDKDVNELLYESRKKRYHITGKQFYSSFKLTLK